MLVLVTGAAGFVGRHLVPELVASGHECVGLDLRFEHPVQGLSASYTGDLQEAETVNRIVAETTPDACIHLGGLAFVPTGTFHPNLMLSVNTLGAVNMLEAFREYSRNTRILFISSAQIYAMDTTGLPIKEDAAISPIGLYSIAKAGADLATLAYADKYEMCTMTARPNNHVGPGQAPEFVVPSFARQVAAIKHSKQKPVMRVGNLECEREFTDVRDVVRAYRLLIEMGQAGNAYNVSSGNMVRIGELLEQLCRLAGVQPEIVVDPAKLRPTDRSPVLDITRLHETTGWQAETEIAQTLKDMLDCV